MVRIDRFMGRYGNEALPEPASENEFYEKKVGPRRRRLRCRTSAAPRHPRSLLRQPRVLSCHRNGSTVQHFLTVSHRETNP